MKITVKNYLENRATFLQSDNSKIVELAQGTDKDLIEVYGQDATIDDAIDTAIERFNQYLESKSVPTKAKATKRTSVSKARAKSVSTLKAKRSESVKAKVKSKAEKVEEKKAKPKATKRTSVSKARAKSVSARKATRKANVVAKVKAKAVKNSTLTPNKSTTKKLAKELKATLDKGDVVKDKQLRKEIVVDTVDGSSFTGHEIKKTTSKAPVKSKSPLPKKDVSLFAEWTKKVKAVKVQRIKLTKAQQEEYNQNEKANNHSENILLLAKITKNEVLIDAAKFCIKENDKYGSLHPESKKLAEALIYGKKIKTTWYKETPSKANAIKSAKAKSDSKPKEQVKAIQKAKAKAEKPKFEFVQGQLVSKGKLLFLVVNAKKDSVSLEEVDGKILNNQSLRAFKAAPISKLDERISKEHKAIASLEKKVKEESESLRKLHVISVKAFENARSLGRMKSTNKDNPDPSRIGTDAEQKFEKLKSLIYQKTVLQAVHRKDIAALKVIAKKSNIDFDSLGMPKKKRVSKPKSFHLLKPKTWF